MMTFRTPMASAVCFVAALAAPGCSEKVSDENYDRITVGMARDQVESFMGEGEQEDTGGFTMSSGGLLGGKQTSTSSKTFSWKSGNKQIVVEFRDEKVVSKRKVGF